MPITVNHALTATTPDHPAYEIRPSHWNDTHNISLSLAASEAIKFVSAGLNSVSSGTIQFADSNGVSFGMDANGVITATVVPGAAAGIAAIAAGTQTATAGTVAFANSNGVTFGMSNSSQITMQFGSQSLAGTGFTSTTTAGTEVEATLGTNGLSMAMPAFLTTAQPPGAYLTTARASNDAIGLNSALTANGVSVTANSSGLSLNFPAFLTTAQPVGAYLTTARASNDAIGLNSALTANGVSMTANSSGLSLNFPAFLTTAAQSNHSHGNPTLNLTNLNGTTASNSAGFTLSLSAAAGGGETAVTMYATSNTTQSSTGTQALSSLVFAGAGIASVGISNGSVVVSVPAGGGGGDGYNIVSMLTSTSGGGTAGATFSALSASVGLMAGSNITLSQTSNTINIIAPASSSLVGSSGISFSTNGSTITAYNAPRSSMVLPQMALSVLGAMGNGSFSIAYRDVMAPVSVTRVDVPFHWVQATTANANTIGIAMTVLCGIYTRNASTLNTVSSASTQTTYTYASNSAGNTQLTVAAYRPVSLPMNINMSGGQYYVGFGISTAATSIGTATTTAAQTISVVGAPQGSSAVPWTDNFTRVTATSVGMFSGHGIYSAAVSSVVPAISLSAINQSGSYFHRANFAMVMRG